MKTASFIGSYAVNSQSQPLLAPAASLLRSKTAGVIPDWPDKTTIIGRCYGGIRDEAKYKMV
ncbi:MAG: hypothetical protein MUO27_08295 [Sedimentisphaerales bacterium]|nr:hypothetical protein [Sedimentisphaerales bacterium]